MNRFLSLTAFLSGLTAVAWVAAGYFGAHSLALSMTLLIGAVYLAGAFELARFDRVSGRLKRALAAIPEPLPSLGAWLATLPTALRDAVRLRIEGERVGLPGPAMAPYLVGLLVLLGMLGTFLGMVVTLNGAVLALESTTDLQAVRAALAAPVKGLGLAFGTSVAGVAASAMLGLMSALCRRERLQTAQALDARIATDLRVFSRSHQREESFKTLQGQAALMPALVDRLQAMMAQMEGQGQALHGQLLAGQERFHRQTETVYAGLAASVDQSLKESLTESARLAGAAIQPVVEATLAGLVRQATSVHDHMADTVQRQLEGVSERFDLAVTDVSATWTAALAQHQRTSERLLNGTQASLTAVTQGLGQQGASLLATLDERHDARQAASVAQDEQRLSAWTAALASMAEALQREWQQAGAQQTQRQAEVCRLWERTAQDVTTQAEAHAKHTMAEMSGLMQAAAQAPQAAAQAVSELRQQLSDSLARDNTLLEERGRILQTVSTLLEALQQASTDQRGAINTLVHSSTALLARADAHFSDKLETQAAQMAEVATQVSGAAVEVASLGEALGVAVQRFSESNDQLMGHLQRIDGALTQSQQRSDEQLAYYVAQAREIIDLSLLSQKQIMEDLQRLPGRQAGTTGNGALGADGSA
ncbi:MAG: DUF802 domain-containing protein [Pseudomonadota bacterium]